VGAASRLRRCVLGSAGFYGCQGPAGDGSHNPPAWGNPPLGSRHLTSDYPNLLPPVPRQGEWDGLSGRRWGPLRPLVVEMACERLALPLARELNGDDDRLSVPDHMRT
jgi:hypothetical protein